MSLLDQLRSILGKNEQQQTPPVVADARPSPPPAQEEQGVERRRRRRINAKRGTRVLIIDDSPTIVAALRKLLNSAKYATLEAFDAESGLQIAQAEQPDLIFLDIVLPGMNGFAALRLMRRDPKTQHIPIIMISGNEQATEQFYANRIGADDFMKKPFSRFEVFARIEHLLDTNHIPRRKGTSAEEGVTAHAHKTPAGTTTHPSAAPVTQGATPTTLQPVPTPITQTVAPTAAPQPAPVQAPIFQPVTPAPALAPHTFTQAVTVTPTAQPTPAVQPHVTYAAPPMPSAVSIAVPTPMPAPAPTVVTAQPVPAPAAPAPVVAPPSHLSSPLEARKELTSMGLQYFDQNQFIAAIKRGDKLAFELFVAGGSVDLTSEFEGKTPLQIAREHGRTQIFAILRSKLAAMDN